MKSCQKAVLWLRWSTFGEDFAMFPRFAQELLIGASRADMFPRSAQGSPVVWGPGIALA